MAEASAECSGETPAIVCERVASGYHGVVLMREINLTIRRGEIVFILGGSGCGKSTLLKHIIGQVPPISGSIRLMGREMNAALPEEERLKRLRTFGMISTSEI